MNSFHEMRMLIRLCVLSCLLFTSALATAYSEKFKWEPLTKADWDIRPDSTKGYNDAVLLLEKAFINDEGMPHHKFEFSLYRRYRILAASARSNADVEIVYVDNEQEVEDIYARAVFPDGKESNLSKEQIHDSKFVDAEGFHVKKISFSIPGVTDDCIMEYHYVRKGNEGTGTWMVQRDIPVLHGEYRWKYFQPEESSYGWAPSRRDKAITELASPNYQWLNQNPHCHSEYIKEGERNTEIVFSVDSLPAFHVEPEMGNINALKTMLFLYYGDNRSGGEYFAEMIGRLKEITRKFCQSDSIVSDSVASWKRLPQVRTRIDHAYDWVKHNFRNVSSIKRKEGDPPIERNSTTAEIVRHGYATTKALNFLFYDILVKLGIEAHMVYTIDRTKHVFLQDAKFFQFDGAIVGIPDLNNKYTFYSPGSPNCDPGFVPPSIEGTTGLVLLTIGGKFYEIPYSRPDSNRTISTYTLALSEDGKCSGALESSMYGQEATGVRSILAGVDSAQHLKLFEQYMTSTIQSVEVDSLSVSNLDTFRAPLRVKSNIAFPVSLQKAGSRMIFQLQASMVPLDNPFADHVREHPILFDFAYEHVDEFTFRLPAGYVVEGLPTDTSFSNLVGRSTRECNSTDSTVMVRKTVRVYKPFIEQKKYGDAQEFFSTVEALDRAAIVLQPKSVPKPAPVSTSNPTSLGKEPKKGKGTKKRK